jgi:hypothetical protein
MLFRHAAETLAPAVYITARGQYTRAPATKDQLVFENLKTILHKLIEVCTTKNMAVLAEV